MRKIQFSWVAILCWAFALSSQTLPTPARPPADVRSTYVLGPEDSIVIHAADVPELSDKPIRLDLSGDIDMPMIGRVRAAGLNFTASRSLFWAKSRLQACNSFRVARLYSRFFRRRVACVPSPALA